VTNKKIGTPKDWALIAAKAALDKKAGDVIVQEVKASLVIVDYFIIATGDNNRQVSAICDHVEEQLRLQADLKPIGREGTEALDWVLLDFGDIVVHVFAPATRDFYRLETLYNDAPVIVVE
jgi:ribosome-associated protein